MRVSQILLHDISHKDAKAQRKMNENDIGKIAVNAAIGVHKALGPGLLESVYEAILAYELEKSGSSVKRQVSVEYIGKNFNEGLRADIIVENKAIVELKSVESIIAAHKKQVLTYLRLTGYKLGFLLNFGAALMKNDISRIIYGAIN